MRIQVVRLPESQKKRKKVEEQENNDVENELSDGEIVETPTPTPTPIHHRAKRRRNEYKGVGSRYISVDILKKKLSSLDGSFEASRSNYLLFGSWELPHDIPEDKFEEVTTTTIKEMNRLDTFNLFADAVTESTAPGYFDVVENPMDFGTMMTKLQEGKYTSGSDGMSQIYKDFLLVMNNCALYNDDNDEVLGEAGRLMGMLPIVYAEACSKIRAET